MMSDKVLKSYWIAGTELDGPIGFGVTAFSLKDAVEIIETAGYVLNRKKNGLVYRAVRSIEDVEYASVRRNCGPIIPRGLWSPYGLAGLKAKKCQTPHRAQRR